MQLFLEHTINGLAVGSIYALIALGLASGYYAEAAGIITGFTEIGEVIKPVQVQIVKDGAFHHFGIVDDPDIVYPKR